MTTEGSIAAAAAEAVWCIDHERQISYLQSRPMEGIGRGKRRKLPLKIDCSAFVTVCYNWAGAPDPNGYNYNGRGYTGTILSHGTQIAKGSARVGDLVVFGRGTGNHVCLVLSTGSNPMLASHGGNSGPIRISFTAELEAQKRLYRDGTVRWIRVPARRERGVRPVEPDVPVAVDLEIATNEPSAGAGGVEGERQDLARQILADRGITLATRHVSGVVDRANAKQNITDTAAGKAATRSSYGTAPGRTVDLNVATLRAMVALGRTYSYRVSEVAGGSHSSGSLHYAGRAFDVDQINGQPVSRSRPVYRAFLEAARKLGADERLGPGDAGHDTHVHAGWR
jgi:hypothetical protein